MLFLFLGIVHSSEVEDYDFNIEHEKRIAGHSTNIALHIVSSTLHCAKECASQHSLIITKIVSEGKSFNLH